ncbi:UNVERIFIED_CONTAM: hypothetical protein HDU68_006007, partial [Siphonaria sp. JEL0065]
VSKGYDLAGDLYGTDGKYVPVPDADPIDNCSEGSHGTHVAGIIAADARNITTPGFIPSIPFTGVAPDANIFAYRVFGCKGSTQTDIIAAAIYRAAEDGAHVISISIGGGPNYATDDDAIAADIVGKAGHFVINSAGNAGANGPYQVGGSGISLGGLAIASFDNMAAPVPYMLIDNVQYPYGVGGNNGAFTENQVLDVVVNDLSADEKDLPPDGTDAGINTDAKGKALLIRWGDTAKGGSAKRCSLAVRSGAVACILYNNGLASVSIAGAKEIPSMFIPRDAGQAIIADIKAGKKPQVIVTFKSMMSPLPTAATLSSFSSPGLDNELNMKPDLGGMGGSIFSTISKFSSEFHGYRETYAVMSGTSMATPYVSGVAALVIQARGKLTFTEFKGYLQNSASLRPIFATNITHSPSYQGAGLVNAFGAASSRTLVTPSSISLNDTDNHLKTVSITIKNSYKIPMNYYLNNENTAAVNSLLPGDDFMQNQATTTFTDKSPVTLKFDGKDGYGSEAWDFKLVRVPAGKSVTVTFKITPPKIDPSLYTVYGGYISIVNDYDDEVITVPYTGVVGSWKKRAVWSRNSPSLQNKWLAGAIGQPVGTASTGLYSDYSYTPLKANEVINATNPDGIPILAIPAITTRDATVTAVYQATNLSAMKKLGFSGNSAFVYITTDPEIGIPFYTGGVAQRKAFATATIDTWAGDVLTEDKNSAVKLPAGPYKLVFKALRGFGRVGVEADYDVITTETFNLVY